VSDLAPESITQEAHRLGAVALDVGLSDFVPARHYRLLQDTVVS
jgi:hypothetical protein